MKIKNGDTIKFNFHGFGMVSQEEAEVTKISKKGNYVQIEDGEPEYRFDLKTGKCLNDNKHMGCYRTLPEEYLID